MTAATAAVISARVRFIRQPYRQQLDGAYRAAERSWIASSRASSLVIDLVTDSPCFPIEVTSTMPERVTPTANFFARDSYAGVVMTGLLRSCRTGRGRGPAGQSRRVRRCGAGTRRLG